MPMTINFPFLQIPSLSSSEESFHEALESEVEDDELNDSDDGSDVRNENQNFRSTARIRGMLETVVKRVITKSQTDLTSLRQVKFLLL